MKKEFPLSLTTMKTLALLTTLAFSANILASTECSLNPYALKAANLVVAYKVSEKKFDPRTGNKVEGDFFFNNLVDSSCDHIEVSDRDIISCVSIDGVKKDVGILAAKAGHDTDVNFFSVNWSKSVVIKSTMTDHGCIYGIAVNNIDFELH